MRAITLLYHDVVPSGDWASSGFQGADADEYKMDGEDFRRHLKAIKDRFAGPLTLAPDLSGRASARADVPVLLTFDDGGAGAIYTADMLDELGWKAHFFVTAGRIDSAGFLTSRQVRELHARGHVIGSHSYTHPLQMARCPAAQLDDEWRRSVACLDDILGEPTLTASVPGGYYSRQVAVSAARAGIKWLFNSEPVTCSHTVEGCLVLGRFGAKRDSPSTWSAAVVAGEGGVRTREYMFWNTKKVAKMILGPVWLRVRVALLERASRAPQSPPSEPGSGRYGNSPGDGPVR